MSFKWNPLTASLDLVGNEGSQDALSSKTLILERQASEAISALKAVYLDTQFSCALADNSDEIKATVIGLSLNSADIGSMVRILVFGILEDPFFGYSISERLFLGSNGSLINYQPANGFLTGIGFGLGSGAIQVTIDKPQIL